MKLANPKKFKRAFKVVENYLDHSTQGIEHLDEWHGEVEVAREYLDPEDWGYFDGYVAQLEKRGRKCLGLGKRSSPPKIGINGGLMRCLIPYGQE
jgi:hypothetical protein